MSNIKAVAKLAGCSTATVSRCFNTPELVRASTRARVMAVATRLGFEPSPIGRQLRTSRSGLIGVMLPSLANPIFADCIGGIETVLDASNRRLLLTTTRYDASREQALIEVLLRQKVDGLLLTVAESHDNPVLRKLAEAGTPHVLLYNHTPDCASVSVDDRTAAADAVRYLIGQGHQRVAMLAGRLAASDRAVLRHQGYLDAMQGAKLTPLALVQADFDAHVLEPQFSQWLATQRELPTAIFCSTDTLALGVIKALRAHGIAIPHDISVMGFDGLEYGQLIEPTLATIRQPNHDIGQQACGQLMRQLEGSETIPGTTTLPHTLVPGRSVSRPRKTPLQAVPHPIPAVASPASRKPLPHHQGAAS